MTDYKFKTSTPKEIRQTLSKLVNMVANDKIEQGKAKTITYMSSYILQSIKLDEQEKQIQELKEIIEVIQSSKNQG
ncbi:MAG: hypothetical protein RSD77_09840 [Romboutsia sp.]